MESSSADVSGGQARQMSEVGRITGVFWEPGPVFENLAAVPRWWVPLILAIILAVIYVASFGEIVGWDTFLEQELAANSRVQQLPAEQQQQIIQQQKGFVGIFSYGGALLGTAGTLLVISGVLLLCFKISGAGELSFRQAFSVTTYSWLPFSLYQVLSIIALYFTNPADFNLRNPLPFNVGWFLDPASSPAWLVSALTSIDIFSFWVMALMALGFSAAARKIGYGKAFSEIFFVWLGYVIVKAGWAALFG